MEPTPPRAEEHSTAPTSSLLVEAACEPLGALALVVMFVAAVLLLFGVDRSLAGPASLADYLLGLTFAAACVFVLVVLRVGQRGPVLETPTVPGPSIEVAPVDRSISPELKAASWLALGDDTLAKGDEPLARGAYREALAAYRGLGDSAGEIQVLRRLGHMERVGGHLVLGRGHYADARQRSRAVADHYAEACTLMDRGGIDRQLGDFDTARAAFAEAKRLFVRLAGELAAPRDPDAQTRTASNAANPSAVRGGANR